MTRNTPGHPKVEELSGYDFEELVDYCTNVLALKPIPDEGLLALVDAFLRAE